MKQEAFLKVVKLRRKAKPQLAPRETPEALLPLEGMF